MDLIFEIGCEEIPASFIEPALAQMKATFVEQCLAHRIDAPQCRTLATPRRLTLIVNNLPALSSDLEEERTGPPAAIAFKDGAPTKAAEGFARGQGVSVDDIYVVDTDKGSYIAAKVFEKGQPVESLLPDMLTTILKSLHFPKSMRWLSDTNNKNRLSFARPIRWLLAVADEKLVPVHFAGIDSGTTTLGHRFAAPDAVEIRSPAQYIEALDKAFVVVDQEIRRAMIVEQLNAVASEVGGELVTDDDLIDEVTNLVEKPHGLTLYFDEKYLELPDEVLISSMRSHQRYFSIKNAATGRLTNACGIIYNTPVKDPKVVAAGNLRVLKARLDDARFFWEKDLQHSLESRLEELSNVIWIAKVGTMKDRSERIAKLAAAIATKLQFDNSVITTAKRAGLLAKTDLVTQMVYEFPDLQGVIGREYALKSGETPQVAQAIYEQYLPRTADDELPQSDAGACVAIAERLDAIAGCFAAGLIPTSQADPYALRRAALGVLKITLEHQYRLSLNDLISLAVDTVAPGAQSTVDDMISFFNTRFKFLLAADYPVDIVDSVLAAHPNDLLSVYGRVEALSELRGEPDFEPLAAGFKRVVNILRKQEDELKDNTHRAIDPQYLVESAETALYNAYNSAYQHVSDALSQRDWQGACKALINLKSPVDEFFDHVMVMTDDANLRNNRIALLSHLRDLFLSVADISYVNC